MQTLVLCLCLLSAEPFQAQWPTLRAVLEKHGVAVPDVPDANMQIASFEARNTPEWFGIGYYWYLGGDLLPPELHIRTFDKRTQHWTSATLNGPYGSILGIDRHHGRVYVRGHGGPSSSTTLVLTEALAIIRELAGWIVLPLSDGRIVYHRSMVHFAPVHPGSLALYDPRTDRDRLLYPGDEPDPGEAVRKLIDRSIGKVEELPDGRIRFDVVEQKRVWAGDRQTTVPAAPVRRFVVTCRATESPICTETPADGH